MRIKTLVVGPIQTNCYVVDDVIGGKAAVIDPGDRADIILAYLEKTGLTPEVILLTHRHFDHIGAVDAIQSAGATVAEAQEGLEIAVGGLTFQVLHTPGHTPDSVCFLCGDALFTGDTLFEDDCGRTDLPGGDYPTILKSLARLGKLPGDYNVYPGHDVSTTLSRERRHNRNLIEGLLAYPG